MSVIVVGDIDVVEMEKKIISHFATYKIAKEKPRKIYDVPNHKETFVAVERQRSRGSTVVL
jgi:zinc protease